MTRAALALLLALLGPAHAASACCLASRIAPDDAEHRHGAPGHQSTTSADDWTMSPAVARGPVAEDPFPGSDRCLVSAPPALGERPGSGAPGTAAPLVLPDVLAGAPIVGGIISPSRSDLPFLTPSQFQPLRL